MMHKQPVGEHQNTKCHIHNAEHQRNHCFQKFMAKHMDAIPLIENRIRHLFVRVTVGERNEDTAGIFRNRDHFAVTSGCMQNTVRFEAARIKKFSVCFHNHGLMLGVKHQGRGFFGPSDIGNPVNGSCSGYLNTPGRCERPDVQISTAVAETA